MTAGLGLILAVFLLVVCSWGFLRRSKSGKFGRWQTVAFSICAATIVFFLLWLAIMVLFVGPSMRGI